MGVGPGGRPPERVAEFVPLSLGDRIGMLFGRARKDPWMKAINNFVEFSPSDSLPYPDYKIRGGSLRRRRSGGTGRFSPERATIGRFGILLSLDIPASELAAPRAMTIAQRKLDDNR